MAVKECRLPSVLTPRNAVRALWDACRIFLDPKRVREDFTSRVLQACLQEVLDNLPAPCCIFCVDVELLAVVALLHRRSTFKTLQTLPVPCAKSTSTGAPFM